MKWDKGEMDMNAVLISDQSLDFLDEVFEIIGESIHEQDLSKEEILESLDYRRR
ncbi:hypothetical protein [Bacillus sp. DE0042]|uniref:hypothetical protein n=1 Tax=Bacillus sp. DE0042 TaxID=2584950 RepID=UPI0016436E2E|nr:hypothetical protein [Bacillus sp. DE0042]